MPHLELTVTKLIDTQRAQRLATKLHLNLAVGGPHLYVRMADPSTISQYIQIIDDVAQWLVLLYPAKVLLDSYLETFGKRVTDVTSDKLFAKKEVKPLAEVATALADAQKANSGRTEIVVGLDIPDPHFSTALHITTNSAEEIAHALTVFVTHANEFSVVMKAEVEAGRAPLGRAIITLEEDGGLTVRWWSQKDFARHEKRIP